MSDHIEHASTNCGSLLHHANRCDKPLQRNPDATPQPAEPPAGAAEDEDTNKKPDIMGWMDVLRPTPPPQPQGGTPEDTPETDAKWNAIVDDENTSQTIGGTKWKAVAIRLCEEMRTLETQRNESRAALAVAQAEVERLMPLAYETRPGLKSSDDPGVTWGEAEQNALRKLYATQEELEQTRRELEKTKARLETYWKKGDEDFATLVTLRQALTAAEQRAEGLSALNQAHAEHLAAARADLDRVADERDTALQRAEGAEKERDEARKAWMAKVDELAAQRDTALRERDEARRKATALVGVINQMANAFNAQNADTFWRAEGRTASLVEEWTPDLAQAIAERDAARKDSARLDWLEKQFEFHWSEGYEEGDPGELQLVEGNINDREYRSVGKADTLRAAIDAALAAKTTEGGVRP